MMALNKLLVGRMLSSIVNAKREDFTTPLKRGSVSVQIHFRLIWQSFGWDLIAVSMTMVNGGHDGRKGEDEKERARDGDSR
jgi:hypothetical protein